MKIIKFILLLWVMFNARAQVVVQDPIYNSSNLPRDVRNKNENVSFEPGIRIPLGKLADIMGPAPELGIWVRGKIHERDYLDVGGSLFAPNKVSGFSYNDRNTTYLVEASGMGGDAGFRLVKLYTLSNNKFKVKAEWLSALGYAFLMYEDAYTTMADNGNINSESDLKALQTYYIGQGVRLTIDNIGLQLNYNYTPYGQFSSHEESSFGAHSCSITAVYKI